MLHGQSFNLSCATGCMCIECGVCRADVVSLFLLVVPPVLVASSSALARKRSFKLCDHKLITSRA
jgi:hypothetical protein